MFFQGDIQNILTKLTNQRADQYRKCLGSCHLVRACGGCTVIDCDFAKRFFSTAMRSAKVYLETVLEKRRSKFEN